MGILKKYKKTDLKNFQIFVVSLHKLSRHMDIGQLPPIFNGSLSYDHRKWLDLRSVREIFDGEHQKCKLSIFQRYEAFLREAAAILKHSDAQHGPAATTMLAVDTSTSKSSSSDSLEFSPIVAGAGLGVRPSQEFVLKGPRFLFSAIELS